MGCLYVIMNIFILLIFFKLLIIIIYVIILFSIFNNCNLVLNKIMSETNEETKKEKRPKSKVKRNQRIKKVDTELLKKQKEILKINQERKEQQYKQVEEYINETGLDIAFNIIFAELIANQILPENFFIYTSKRLIEIGKEVEGMEVNIPKYNDIPLPEGIEDLSSKKNKEEIVKKMSNKSNKNENKKNKGKKK